MKNNILLILFVLCSFLGFSQTEYLDGVIVLNEGGAGGNEATISFIDNNTVTNNVFGLANPGMDLGDTAQSLTMYNDLAVVVLNISNEVKIVNNKTFQHIATISGLNNPRYSAVYNNKAYVTCWGSATDDYLAVIDLTTNTLETTITVADGTEKIKEINGKLYIAHQNADFVTVYNIATQQSTQIQVEDTPSELVTLGNDLYVLCGVPSWGLPTAIASLHKIDLSTDTATNIFTFPAGVNAFHMDTDGTDFFITAGADIYKYDVSANTLTTNALISTPVNDIYMGIYGMNVINNNIYVADANGYVADGKVYVYSLQGSLLNTFTVGKIPNHFYKSKASLSVKNPEMVSVSVYPNPASDILNIQTAETITNVTAYNIAGQKVLQANTQTVNVSALKAGVYILKVETLKGSATLKFVKK